MLSSAGVIAMGKGADVGVGRKTARKRAVGTREHIIAYLSEASELFDANGMASTQLAAAVGYGTFGTDRARGARQAHVPDQPGTGARRRGGPGCCFRDGQGWRGRRC